MTSDSGPRPASPSAIAPGSAPRSGTPPGGSSSGAPLDPPRTLPAANGLAWLREGWELFREAPETWAGILLTWIVVSAVLSLIPLLANLLAPVFGGGLMLGCAALAEGGRLSWNHLFAGFRYRFKSLILVGVLTLVATLAATILGLIVFLGVAAVVSVAPDDVVTALMGLFQGRGQVAMPDPMALLAIVLCLVILSLTVSIPLVMTLWFAPALVVLHDVSAVRAMVLSFRGCLANLMPFLLYGLAVIGLAIVATIPFGLGWLVLAPVLVTSTYTACQEIFAPRG